MEFKKLSLFLVIGILALSVVVNVNATVNGAQIVNGTESSYTPSSSAGSTNVTAGGTKEANFTVTSSTSRWAGFYGTIGGTITLADASSNYFKNWTITSIAGGYLYSSTATNPVFSSLSAAAATDMPTWLNDSSYADAWQNTFTAHEIKTFNAQSIDANYTMTYNNAGTETFKTYSLKDSSSNLIWAALAQSTTGYNGKSVDYQLLVPVNGSTTTKYYFWVELP